MKLATVSYELKQLQSEKDMLILQHDKELRDAQAKADADFKRYQSSASASGKATQRYELLQKEVKEMQDMHVNEKTALERQIRDLRDQASSLREDAEDVQGRLSDQDRHYKYQLIDVEAKRAALEQTVDKIKQELAQMSQSFEASQKQLSQRDAQTEALEAQMADLKSHTGDTDALNVLQSQLTDQVSHMRSLETTNREQLAELRQLRDAHRSVQVVEEQKRGLETELHVLKDVERQLGEAQIQKEILEDEKRQWSSLLDRDGQEMEFESPEAVVRALVQARIEQASLADRLGTVEAEMLEKDEQIKSLDNDKTHLQGELEQRKTSGETSAEPVDNKGYKRLERQKNLATKEVEYLRAQLKTFDSEETMMTENQNVDTQKTEQIQQLESLVDQYRSEISTLHTDMTKLESVPPQTEPRGTKRRAEPQDPEEDVSGQVGPLLRKNKNLQVALQKTAQQSQMLATELQAAKSQLKALRESSKTRVLELRGNPTSEAEAIKMSTLRTLKEENQSLLAQVRGEDLQGAKTVPASTVDALKLDLQGMEKVVAEKEKRMRRQREIWSDKAAEFRDVIASVLGWRINFLPNGKAKVSSMFYGPGQQQPDSEDEDAHYIIFDGENGTMKISGGADGSFGKEIKEQVDFWVKEKKEIPGFLAALTIQFHDEYRSR